MATPARKDTTIEILDLRHFTSADVRWLLEQETRLWAKLLAWDYRSSAEMILRYVDAKILPGYAALDSNGGVAGYSFFVYEGSKGVIGDMFVLDGMRRDFDTNEVELRLLRHVIGTLQQSPGVHRVEAQLLAHESGRVSMPFVEDGFRIYPRLFMVLKLRGPDAPAARVIPPPFDLEIRRWSDSDYQGVANLITAAYRGHVDADINDQYRTVSGSLRFLNNIVRFPGCGVFDNNASFVAVQRSTRMVVGAILCSRVKEDVGHVTQVCVLPDYRGKRIGEMLLEATANNLRRRNFDLLTLTVTEANRGAVQLYERLGYEIRRVFDAFVWEG